MEAECYRIAVEQRIAELWRYRSWWREHRWAEHPLKRQETDIELRALVRIARQARKAARIADRHHESAVLALLVADETELERAAAWGYA